MLFCGHIRVTPSNHMQLPEAYVLEPWLRETQQRSAFRYLVVICCGIDVGVAEWENGNFGSHFIRVANLLVSSGELQVLQLASRWQRSIFLEKMALLEGGLNGTIPCKVLLFPCPAFLSLHPQHLQLFPNPELTILGWLQNLWMYKLYISLHKSESLHIKVLLTSVIFHKPLHLLSTMSNHVYNRHSRNLTGGRSFLGQLDLCFLENEEKYPGRENKLF